MDEVIQRGGRVTKHANCHKREARLEAEVVNLTDKLLNRMRHIVYCKACGKVGCDRSTDLNHFFQWMRTPPLFSDGSVDWDREDEWSRHAKAPEVTPLTMLRIVCSEVDADGHVHLGGPVVTNLKSFVVEAPSSLIAWLANSGTYRQRAITGVELESPTPEPECPHVPCTAPNCTRGAKNHCGNCGAVIKAKSETEQDNG